MTSTTSSRPLSAALIILKSVMGRLFSLRWLIVSAGPRVQELSCLLDASCGSGLPVMRSWRDWASGWSIHILQVNDSILESPMPFFLSSLCISFIALYFVIQKPLLHPDPEFHLHIGGLLNPIPGKQKIHMYVVCGGWGLFQGARLLIALETSFCTDYLCE